MSSPIHKINFDEAGFPTRLISIPYPPTDLYFQGDLSLVNDPKLIAIVGTRTPTPEAVIECQYITQWFVENGYVIVSGLAIGIDTVAHETCLRYDGRTIAVLPSGIGNIYPIENKELIEIITQSGGLILSEYQEKISSRKSYFIQRNRLQSGLSLGVVVIESEISGGTMYTAKFAIKHNRVLGCVEFPDYSDKRRGNKKLLSSGKAFGINRQSLREFELFLKSPIDEFLTKGEPN